MKGYHHFRFSNDSPGRIFCKRYVDSAEVEFDLLKHPAKLPPCTLPPIVNPAGLDLERRSYLYEEIRQFCKLNSANLVAPKPWNGNPCSRCKLHSLWNNWDFECYGQNLLLQAFLNMENFCLEMFNNVRYFLWFCTVLCKSIANVIRYMAKMVKLQIVYQSFYGAPLTFSNFLLQGKILCFARLGKSLVRCLFLKRSEDLVQKIIPPVIFDTNCSFKQWNALS